MEGGLSWTDRNVSSQLCHTCQSKHVTFRENVCLLKALVDFQLGCHGNGNHRGERKGSICDMDVDWPKKKRLCCLEWLTFYEAILAAWEECSRLIFRSCTLHHIILALYATCYMTSAVLKKNNLCEGKSYATNTVCKTTALQFCTRIHFKAPCYVLLKCIVSFSFLLCLLSCFHM